MAKKQKIGFIGLGMLGQPMAYNLLQQGHQLKIYNRTSAKALSLVEHGAEIKRQPWEVADPGGIVMSCVSDDNALASVVGDNGEIAEILGSDGIHVSMSTILPKTAARLAHQQAVLGGYYVAAPVMGRPDAVEAKKQSYFVAGEPAAKARVRPILEGICTKVFDFGDHPADANVAKLAANFLIASAIEAMAEAFVFSLKNGSDPYKLLASIGDTLFACPIYQNYGRQILDKNYKDPLFKLALGLKDIRLVAETAAESYTPMRFLKILEDRFSAAVAHDRSDYDWTGIAAEVADEAGL